jgi:hypothetical protein
MANVVGAEGYGLKRAAVIRTDAFAQVDDVHLPDC